MRVLVAAASRHESTAEVAAQIGRVLSAAGHRVETVAPEDVTDVGGYEAAVIGSAIYYGRWLPTALDLVRRHQTALGGMPVWLFSVGALVDPAAQPTSSQAADLLRQIPARGHRAFRGALAAERLSWWERAMVSLVRAPCGDFRDWTAVRNWAHEITQELVGGERLPSSSTAGTRALAP
jgi:menaquinone-dependent protoporphyrinogen oxidase